MKSKFYMVFALVAVCLISAIALSQVFSITQIKIEKQKTEAVLANLNRVLPSAFRFEEVTAVPQALWIGFDQNGKKVGIVFKIAPRGYGGPIETLVGIDTSQKITGIHIASAAEGLKETPGLGLKVRDDWFRNQFIEKTKNDLKLKRDGGAIDAITAATISSRAVTDGIKQGLEMYGKYLKADSIQSQIE
ncbi:MAG: RnfABCDGE type electron transport complex subunit G [candidate division WOR-3 bacterium]|nr:RnfABCDGE type electron transport complex subunit G [candidate division WOR-3 bacterium]